jgi:UDP-N-acetylmuramate--alanine ligase
MSPPLDISPSPSAITPIAVPVSRPVPSDVALWPRSVDVSSVYMLGVGGCGMAGLTRMLRGRGIEVGGSDMSISETTDALAAEGVRIDFDQSWSWLPDGVQLVVASAAIKADHPQRLEAERRGLPVLTYAEALGRCMEGRTGVAIAGTHGKSTTTGMLGAALVDAGLDPTVIVGATCEQLSRGCLSGEEWRKAGEGRVKWSTTGFRLGADAIPCGALAGRPGILIAEACEFNRSFHNYRPVVASISSVEADHLDIYGSLDAVVEAFHEFAKLVAPSEEGGHLLIAHDGAHRREVTAGLSCTVETIGFSPEADWVVEFDPRARQVTLSHGSSGINVSWTMQIPGVHNAMNAATAAALAIILGSDPAVIGRSLTAFRGVDRRMQFLGERPLHGGEGVVRVYDDYGHHPTEVEATLRALREFERPQDRAGRLICIFQPHQHSRTRHLMEEFAAAFSSADLVIVPHIYFVRDTQAEKHKVSAVDLVHRLRQRGIRAMHVDPFEAIVEHLETLCRPGDLVVVMGAGPVYQIGHQFMQSGGGASESAERGSGGADPA